MMLTPSGRFEPGAKICLSISDFHPESWNPLWGVSMILLGLQSFFYETASTTGALHNVSAAEKRRFASQSLEFNSRNMTYRKLFPDLIKLAKEKEIEQAKKSEVAAVATDGKNVEKGKKNKKGSVEKIVAHAAGGAIQQQQEGEAGAEVDLGRIGGGGGGRLGVVGEPMLGAREIALGAAAVVIAVGVASIALDKF
jgi:hypothetical protein